MRTLISIQIVAATMIVPALAHAQTVASAQDTSGFYIEGHVGISQVSDTEIEYYDVGGAFGGTGPRDSAAGSVALDRALAFGGALGYDFGTVRTELDVTYSKNDISALTIESFNGSSVTISPDDADAICDYLEVASCTVSGNTISYDGGRIRQLSAMANLWLDLPVGSVFVPYLGGGIGASGFESDGEGEVKFAWQVGGGAAVNVGGGAALTANFRHRRVSETEIAYDANSGFNVGAIRNNEFSLGARFTF